jgi:hypothetical protein
VEGATDPEALLLVVLQRSFLDDDFDLEDEVLRLDPFGGVSTFLQLSSNEIKSLTKVLHSE